MPQEGGGSVSSLFPASTCFGHWRRSPLVGGSVGKAVDRATGRAGSAPCPLGSPVGRGSGWAALGIPRRTPVGAPAPENAGGRGAMGGGGGLGRGLVLFRKESWPFLPISVDYQQTQNHDFGNHSTMKGSGTIRSVTMERVNLSGRYSQ